VWWTAKRVLVAEAFWDGELEKAIARDLARKNAVARVRKGMEILINGARQNGGLLARTNCERCNLMQYNGIIS
jgi:hypothetical protein